MKKFLAIIGGLLFTAALLVLMWAMLAGRHAWIFE